MAKEILSHGRLRPQTPAALITAYSTYIVPGDRCGCTFGNIWSRLLVIISSTVIKPIDQELSGILRDSSSLSVEDGAKAPGIIHMSSVTLTSDAKAKRKSKPKISLKIMTSSNYVVVGSVSFFLILSQPSTPFIRFIKCVSSKTVLHSTFCLLTNMCFIFLMMMTVTTPVGKVRTSGDVPSQAFSPPVYTANVRKQNRNETESPRTVTITVRPSDVRRRDLHHHSPLQPYLNKPFRCVFFFFFING